MLVCSAAGVAQPDSLQGSFHFPVFLIPQLSTLQWEGGFPPADQRHEVKGLETLPFECHMTLLFKGSAHLAGLS